jgi:prephenate dehydrogenase
MANTIPFRRVAVIGTGLIGGSFALALRGQFPEISLIGYDFADALELARAQGAIDETATDIPSAVRGADLVYVALPIGATIAALGALAASAEPSALITDASSTKVLISRAARAQFRSEARFLGGHPMAGKERSGIENADAGLFRGAPYALIAAENDPDTRVRDFARLLLAIGAQPVWCDAETHDWAVAIVSHLPQLVAVETGLPVALAGGGLQDTLRLAGSPYGVWRDILLTNKDNISRALDRLEQALDHLRTRLASKELEQEFQAANELYKILRKPP